MRYLKVERNYFEKAHRNEITSKRHGQATLIFEIWKTYKYGTKQPRFFSF